MTEESYEALRRRRRKGESFADIMLRFASDRPLSEVAGILTDEQADALEDAITRSGERCPKR